VSGSTATASSPASPGNRCKLLVWYAAYDDLQEARLRELQMKKWKRLWKLREIEQMNPEWQDLYPTLL
jgi:putative endonuclease